LEIRRDIKDLCQKQNDQERDQILDWLSSTKPSTRQSEIFNSHHTGTGTWFLETKEFREWIRSEKQILFCLGVPGAGKTILTSIIINHLEKVFDSQDGIGITYFFCDYRERATLLTLLCALLRQLCQRQTSIPDGVKSLYVRHATKMTRPSNNEIFRELRSIIAKSKRVFFIIDALDECPVSDGISSVRQSFLRQLVSLNDELGANILATSRPDKEIAAYLRTYVSVEIQPRREDIESYLDLRMTELPDFVHKRPTLKQRIKNGIIEAAGEM
jgi:Cdc6-like AAA superfamily ATPase